MNIIQKLAESFQKFPGIGPRQARRFVDFLIKESFLDAKKLADTILELRKTVKSCQNCGYNFIPLNLSSQTEKNPKCPICQNPNRDKSCILVVEKDIDLENIEKSKAFEGRYFILGFTVSDLNTIQSVLAKKRFEKLFDYTKQNKELKEIILATGATAEGEATAVYLERVLEPLKNSGLKISRLGRGLSTGTELEYSDSATIKNALENRK